MADRAITSCDQCGAYDDHPKVHYGLNTWHHDCTPARIKNEILGGAIHAVDADVLAKVFDAAENGVHGNELVAHIVQLHEGTDNG
jgi:hypothetical protein